MEENFFELMMRNQQQQQLQKVVSCNEYTQKYGVTLSQEDALLLLERRKQNLKEQERVEFGEGILQKLIFTFCDSSYIYQDNYVDTIDALQEIFYLYKNESLDELTDDELLEYMKEKFDGVCQGSLEYLEDTCLEGFAREIRKGTHGFMGGYDEEG
ncbi:MAG TPA: DUF6323 family protein [Lachnospiraceae bacterium]|nr:DUF6323 family protein [Lachnospiraceae bacterium]